MSTSVIEHTTATAAREANVTQSVSGAALSSSCTRHHMTTQLTVCAAEECGLSQAE